jgi:hypothetical protein
MIAVMLIKRDSLFRLIARAANIKVWSIVLKK